MATQTKRTIHCHKCKEKTEHEVKTACGPEYIGIYTTEKCLRCGYEATYCD